MVGTKELLCQLEGLEREIDSLLEERASLDHALHSTSLRLSLPGRLYLRFTIRGLKQRLVVLKLRRNMVYNGYLQLRRDEARRS
ncbi:hypothetical protein [Rubrobacter aplysinae]|uniref:hypothetical protein n=1 Tax=Rubrobacter aplysinae TaxID=909625 RepID=UPI00128D34EE|nr:hypothetical protein [Rubrobacter aplysinae]